MRATDHRENDNCPQLEQLQQRTPRSATPSEGDLQQQLMTTTSDDPTPQNTDLLPHPLEQTTVATDAMMIPLMNYWTDSVT